MKKTYTILLLFWVGLSFSQTEKENYGLISNEFKSFYNVGNYEAIFNMFDATMKNALPLERTISFFEQNVNAGAGKIDTMEFSKLKGGAHIYKTTFEKAILDVLISLNEEDQINGLYLSQHIPEGLEVIERNSTPMILPFNEEWFVFWGGTLLEQNYHVAYNNQKYAYDLMMVSDGKSYTGDPRKNENYFVFGKDIIAPCDAEVVKVIKGVEDNIPGQLNPAQLTGNTIVLKTANTEYLLFAHLKKGSIIVEEGQKVKQGELMGQCGNSGNTTEPHLHLSLQNDSDMGMSTGGKIYFDKILVNGAIKEDYLPIKNDNIQNIKLD